MKPTTPRPRGRPPKYPWDKWFASASGKFTVTQGKDFTCPPSSFACSANRQARCRGLTVSCSVDWGKGRVIVTVKGK